MLKPKEFVRGGVKVSNALALAIDAHEHFWSDYGMSVALTACVDCNRTLRANSGLTGEALRIAALEWLSEHRRDYDDLPDDMITTGAFIVAGEEA